MRVMPLAEPAELDVTVPLAGITDRLARQRAGGAGADAAGAADDGQRRAGRRWRRRARAGSRWASCGAEDLRAAAAAGIAEIAQGSPEGSGAHAVAALRQQRLGPRHRAPPRRCPRGRRSRRTRWASSSDGPVRVFAHGRWTRVSTVAGHVLVR